MYCKEHLSSFGSSGHGTGTHACQLPLSAGGQGGLVPRGRRRVLQPQPQALLDMSQGHRFIPTLDMPAMCF